MLVGSIPLLILNLFYFKVDYTNFYKCELQVFGLYTCETYELVRRKNKHSSSVIAAKSLQSCPTLCDPRDGSPPGSPVPGILKARTLEWVAISFSNA